MSGRLRTLLNAYRERGEADREKTVWEFAAERDPWVFSHHPPGNAFREHVWAFRGLYFCKGCVVTFCGMLFGTVLYAVTGWLNHLTDLHAGAVFVLMLTPSLIVHFRNMHRIAKHVSRFVLGVLIVSSVFMLFVTESWVVRLTIVAAYLATKLPLERARERENRRIAKEERSR